MLSNDESTKPCQAKPALSVRSCGLPLPAQPILSPMSPTLAETHQQPLNFQGARRLNAAPLLLTCRRRRCRKMSSSMGINKKRKPTQFVTHAPLHQRRTSSIIHMSLASRRLNNLVPLIDHFVDLLILVLEKAKCICNIIPFPLIVCSRQSRRQLVRKLFRVLVLLDEA